MTRQSARSSATRRKALACQSGGMKAVEPGLRSSPLWRFGGVISLVILIPALRAAAKRDVKLRHLDSHGFPVSVREHAGLFIAVGCLVALPALASAVLGRSYRALNVVVGVLCIGIAVACELFVSITTW
ncbi:MAG: hypothetical protein JWM40_1029 [Frankiales bacterium]|nr:hypothetical protein [Frankiales bacterium]